MLTLILKIFKPKSTNSIQRSLSLRLMIFRSKHKEQAFWNEWKEGVWKKMMINKHVYVLDNDMSWRWSKITGTAKLAKAKHGRDSLNSLHLTNVITASWNARQPDRSQAPRLTKKVVNSQRIVAVSLVDTTLKQGACKLLLL